MLLLYAGLFAALALVGLGCWKWLLIQERWYCYKYEKTQDPAWRLKLEKLGEKHPELMLSRWFCLAQSEDACTELLRQRFPLPVRRKALNLWLKERLKGNWWAERCVPGRLRVFPGPSGPDDWAPSADLLRDALRRMPQPPSSTGQAIFEFYEVCLGLAYCGDRSVLPYLESQMFNGTGCYPDDPAAITDCYQGTRGVVALAASGNPFALRSVERALGYRRLGGLVAQEIRQMLETGCGYRAENLEQMEEALAEYENRRAVERAAAEVRCRELAEDIAQRSSAGYVLTPGRGNDVFTWEGNPLEREGGCIVAGRVIASDGTARVERLTVDSSGRCWLRESSLSHEEHLAFWRELLEFDIWRFSPPETARRPGSRRSYEDQCEGALVAFRAGERYRRLQRDGPLRRLLYPDDPSVMPFAMVEQHLPQSGPSTELSKGHTRQSVVDRWLRGEPWEEIAKAAAAPPPALSAIRP
jgi:hypothetical protein